MNTTVEPKTLLVCDNCGSADVVADAWVDVNTGEVVSTFDAAHCRNCDTDTTLTRRTVYPPTFTWRVTAESLYHEPHDQWDLVRDERFTGDGPGLEEFVVEFAKTAVIGVDDDRYDGHGAPISTIIKIEYQPETNV